MTHDQLVQHLAQARLARGDEIVVTEKGLGRGSRMGRADVLTLTKSRQLVVTIFEVKTNRRDFNSDTQQRKFMLYRGMSHRLYFAAPVGVLHKTDIPDGCGLIVLGECGWRVVKSCRVNAGFFPDADFYLGLLYRLHDQMEKAWAEVAKLKAVERRKERERERLPQWARERLDAADRATRDNQRVEEHILGRIGEALGVWQDPIYFRKKGRRADAPPRLATLVQEIKRLRSTIKRLRSTSSLSPMRHQLLNASQRMMRVALPHSDPGSPLDDRERSELVLHLQSLLNGLQEDARPSPRTRRGGRRPDRV